ncbi:major facilitator superfamily domain-containing protein [Suillus clintonianus]|uniref:major facilitator superfamily domain-containing protein n=1 Tax=Suillus clintonianus TaxID=1904413 RepID=UPI001B862A81|nr:major facilitator superfamily domain-containing protein [Suillus clintonianus]KAG2155612.1 major facilitator superfamily domain-containing protein [Suillus clintonianus]
MVHPGQTHHNSATSESPKTEGAVAHEAPEELKDGRSEAAEKPYSIYTRREKWFIVVVASLAALFSPLTANVYFPAIPTIASAFHTSIESINLSVTVYMVLQGVSPMFWGTMADRIGRRPVFLACLLVLCLSCIGLALVPTSAYWLLMLLRCIQAAGSASTVALGAGVIGDIATPAERGGFFGLFTVGPQVGPAIGPIIGGVLADTLGWRSIFWFLCIMSAACFALMLMFLPETLRRLVGDGSVIPSPFYRPLVPLVGKGRVNRDAPKPPKRTLNNPLRLFFYLDVLNLLVFNAILYAVFYAVNTTISTLFATRYPFLNEIDIGLCFLAIGGGMTIGTFVSGKMLDVDYQRTKTRLVKKAEEDPEKRIRPEDVTKEENFPIERARLRMVPIFTAIFVLTCAGYGWSLERKTNIAVPLILQIIFGYTVTAIMISVQTLLIDLLPSQSSSITACNNLVRCSLGALMVSVIDLIVSAIGAGWTYVLLAGVCLACSSMIWVAIRIGPRCRAKRRARSIAA